MKRFLSLILAISLIMACFSMVVFAENATERKIIGANLEIGSTLTVNYYAELDEVNDNVEMRFIRGGNIKTVKGVRVSGKQYKFAYNGVNPQCMNDNIKAELILNGEVVETMEQYSVKDYCNRQNSKSAAELGFTKYTQYLAFKRLLADMLTYGSASQIYQNYNTSNLVDQLSWVAEQKSIFSAPVGVKEIFANTDANCGVVSAGVRISNVVQLYFKIKVTESAVVTLNGKPVDVETLEKNGDVYTVVSNDIKAIGFSDIYTLKITDGNTVKSEVRYNVDAYIQNKCDIVGKDALKTIVRALHNYGTSAKKYVTTLTPDENFELDDEDDFSSEASDNLIPDSSSDFENVVLPEDTLWKQLGDAEMSIKVEDNNSFLSMERTESTPAYYSPQIAFDQFVAEPGLYIVSFKYRIDGTNISYWSFKSMIRTSGETSFSSLHGTNYFDDINKVWAADNDQWHEYSEQIEIKAEDIGKGGTWNYCFQGFQSKITKIDIDDFSIVKANYDSEKQVLVDSAETWRANEIVLVSNKEYGDPFTDVEVGLVLSNGNKTYKVPGFWDGGNTWRIRFMCPTTGLWNYTTQCDDTSNTGLHGVSGTLICNEYSGDLDIYKKGFLKIEENTRYFQYNDGTPFFYLGDTHWNLNGEPMEVMQPIVDKRAEQGFTVIQSQPLGGTFDFTDGVQENDILGLQKFDAQFKYIADKGMVHANAQFFFPSQITTFINNFGGFSGTVLGTATHSTGEYQMYDLSDTAKEALERLCRYWVARYSSYPVIWTLGQEVDDDFYWERDDDHLEWNRVNNPYKYVAQYLSQYDTYNNLLTAHMEGYTENDAIQDYNIAGHSIFVNDSNHDFYAMQWRPGVKHDTNIDRPEKMLNSSNKPIVTFEARYCGLWGKDFSTRATGWISYLSGLFGYGYGAQDIWCYGSTYSEDENSTDHVDTITSEEKKAATWKTGLNYASAQQMKYMKDFLVNGVGDWQNLIPRFKDEFTLFSSEMYLIRSSGAYAAVASNSDNSKIAIYFFNFSDPSIGEVPNSEKGTATGKIYNLSSNTTYKYKWFNPLDGTYSEEKTVSTTQYSSTLTLPEKPATTDYVLYVYK